jgi:hypothetical protein
VVRWQPASLSEDLSVSPVTLVDFVQPLPGRVFSVVRRPGAPAIITLRGASYLELDPTLKQRVSVSLFSATATTDDRWTAIPGFTEIDMPRPPRQIPLDAVLVPGAPADTEDWWTVNIMLPDPNPGTVHRLVVVERELWHSLDNDTGPGASRVVHVGTLDL